MRCLIISDIHLKTKMFEMADKILEAGLADCAVQVGDLVDDWGEEYNISLYERMMQRAIRFHKDHPNTLWCIGNHDFGYDYPNMGVKESGHSQFCEGIMGTYLREMERIGAKRRIVHIVDDVIFTHAGLTKQWAERRLKKVGYKQGVTPAQENLIHIVNHAITDELWQEDSPIWARPQVDDYEMYPAKLQVVGHTPVRTICQDNGVLSTDTFSTYRNGTPYGDQTFAIVDTETGEWTIVEGGQWL